MRNSVIKLLFLFLVVSSSCTSSTEPKTETAEVATTALNQSQSSGTMSSVNYQPPSIDRTAPGEPAGSPFQPEQLQEVFPLDAGGLNRFSGANGKPKLMENQVGSQSRIVYQEPDKDQQISLTIIDSGTLGLTMDQIVPWIKTPRNQETANSIEKTGALKGFPYYELYIKDAKEGELHLLVNKRFEIIVKGNNVPYETLREVLEGWDLSTLY